VRQDNGLLHPGEKAFRLRNFPSGEVFVVPNESPESKTKGEIPVAAGDEIIILIVEKNRIVDTLGEGPIATQKRPEFQHEKALCNIAEVAIGCNDKAVVTGNVLEDEKAGFHWAFGRSDFLGGTVSPKDFSAPDKVLHQDIVYAKGNPIVCERLDFIFPDGTRKTAITDGRLILENGM
jgi:leucyl aminopeptidase (aminopeptidase T)